MFSMTHTLWLLLPTNKCIILFSRAVFFVYLYFSISYFCCICSFFCEMNHEWTHEWMNVLLVCSLYEAQVQRHRSWSLFLRSSCSCPGIYRTALIIQTCSLLFTDKMQSCSLKSKNGPERELWSLGCLLFWVFCHLAVMSLPLTAT